MARTTPGVTRRRILDEAVRLFATRGYDATSVADIQAACGLNPGSGALYKHFPSKAALLEAAVHDNLERLATRTAATSDARLPDDPREALRVLADVVWAFMAADRDLIRLMIREFTGFPELFEQMWQGVVATVYHRGTAWITTLRDQGRVSVPDPEATAAVLVASLTYYPILDVLIGHTPGDLAPDRFLDAWLDSSVAALGLPPG
ncbi:MULTISPECIES: TetR/AcrR family transcriptional regulator [unclassified Amycolatopsis]|uniref:TetR/AcrR family transcriptional regulator n=1 Tax=unclassified Amycolatopsis TaxID=2618356 RepID=UPI00287523B0|nr:MULTISPECIES: TetR/AcrR family transcriptional regulator [unclassified Amycolatopsis]MDS0139384.1 TetR/AcrR family transcriptional regulator [Amycolatopsis sp. 505]MDS0149535.1 TetR/AcrR family transcriptional regulator [Amycolatopsis sp. CM201R]